MQTKKRISQILSAIWPRYQQQTTKNFIGFAPNELISVKTATKRFFDGSTTEAEKVLYGYPDLCRVHKSPGSANKVFVWEVLDALEEYRQEMILEYEKQKKAG